MGRAGTAENGSSPMHGAVFGGACAVGNLFGALGTTCASTPMTRTSNATCRTSSFPGAGTADFNAGYLVDKSHPYYEAFRPTLGQKSKSGGTGKLVG
jgi:hypothetical protein